jgi:hypothetical protein
MKLERRSTYRVSGPLRFGDSVSHRSRRYRLLDLLDYTNRYGYITQLLRWEGNCIECSQTFTFETTKAKFSPPARCSLHR